VFEYVADVCIFILLFMVAYAHRRVKTMPRMKLDLFKNRKCRLNSDAQTGLGGFVIKRCPPLQHVHTDVLQHLDVNIYSTWGGSAVRVWHTIMVCSHRADSHKQVHMHEITRLRAETASFG
jgi:hypothetical protein